MDKAPRNLNTLLPLSPNRRVEKSFKVEQKPVKLVLSRKEQGPYTIQVIVTGKQKYVPLFRDTVENENELNYLWDQCLKNIRSHS